MKIYNITLLLILGLLFSACNKDTIEPNQGQSPVYNVIVDIQQTHYGAQTKADYTWPNGATLYIRFNNDKATGTAVYNNSTKTWTMTPPQGALTMNDTTNCSISYFEKAAEGDIINLNWSDVIYSDTKASYLLKSDTLTLMANLSPKTARLRFKGTEGEKIKLYGTAQYSKFNINEQEFYSTNNELELTVNSDGYTPYIHAFFPNDTKRLEITDKNNKIYVFKCSDEHLKAGVSGYFDIPTPTSLGSWKMYDPVRTFKIDGTNAELKMVYVQWINGSYYIAETETTQTLWSALMTENPSTFKSDTEELPVESMTVAQMYTFIENLNSKTGYPFTLPGIDRWIHAAKGGNKSKGYIYSGSDTLDVVAWHVNNAEQKTHPVKTKQPNELGIYDMNGNVYEIYTTADYYSYTNYFKHVIGGGFLYYDNSSRFYYDDYKLSTIIGYEMNGTHQHNISGFRLCLNI